MKNSDRPVRTLGATTEVTGGSLAAGGSAVCLFLGPVLCVFGNGFHCSVLIALWSHVSYEFWVPT